MNRERQPAENLPEGVNSGFVQVGEIYTHYLEARPPHQEKETATVLLVHSGEFSARSEFSWRYNIAELGKHFRVLAPDMVGFGRTDLVHSFTDAVGFRAGHLRRFLDTLKVGPVHVAGNSFGGGLVLQMAANE
ncbi:MAG: alpha/beta fold hydrolase, partial [Deltaproteobacteria bacterium]|nr:alpha/beta fold hydrolase [Deltaproteobacteria bacterium]